MDVPAVKESPSARRLAFEIACVIALGLLIALAYAEPFGAKNQQTYLLDGLRLAYPDLYSNDWFVTQNHHYHFAFAYLTAPLFKIDPQGSVAIGVLHILVTVATFAAIYGLVAAVAVRNRIALFAGVAGFVVLGGGHSLGGGYLYAGYIQPSSLATLGWLVAMNAWIRDRPMFAGVTLAVGAAFHLNYAVLGIGIFALCELATQGFRVRRLAMVLAPSLVVVAVFLPTLIASSHSSEPKLALDVLVQFIFPGHFKPSRLRLDLLALVGWHMIALSVRPVERETSAARLFWFATVSIGTVILAVATVSIPPLLGLTRLFTWRIAPLGMLAAQVLLFVAVRDIARREREYPRGWALVGLLVGAAAVVFNAFTRPRGLYPEVVSCTMVAFALVVALRRDNVVSALCAALCAFALWTKREPLRWPALFAPNDGGVLHWASTQSPRDAVFLTPPYYGEYRLLSRRAVVVDDKSPPMYNDELVAWYRRLCETVDAPNLTSVQDAGARWDALPADRLVAIARRFQAGYVVLAKNRSTARLDMPIAYEDADNLVYSISPR